MNTLSQGVAALVIGASAGGVDAVGRLLAALPAAGEASVFVVLHVPRERPSLLPQVFQPRCAWPVREACDKQPIEPGVVYLAPPDYHLLIDAGSRIASSARSTQPSLALSCDDPVHFSRPSIDVLFESAADRYREQLVGVILTGGSDDGADGLQAVRLAGGRTIVQLPEDAQAARMPQAALARGPVEAVLTLVQIAALLATLPSTGGGRAANPVR